jgi:hypothetical protein
MPVYLKTSHNLISLFHVIASFSLLFIGEYSTAISLQFVFILSLFSLKKAFYFIYLPLIHYSLLKIFASGYYLIYFFDFFALMYILQTAKTGLSRIELYLFMLYIAVLYAAYFSLKENIYDMYIMIDINDKVNYISSEISYILSLIHILIFFFIEFKNKMKKFEI